MATAIQRPQQARTQQSAHAKFFYLEYNQQVLQARGAVRIRVADCFHLGCLVMLTTKPDKS